VGRRPRLKCERTVAEIEFHVVVDQSLRCDSVTPSSASPMLRRNASR
jgi:hypothetical protein